MPVAALQHPASASASTAESGQLSSVRRRRRAIKRFVLSAFAVAWIVGCALVLVQVFTAVRLKCAGCPECVGTAP